MHGFLNADFFLSLFIFFLRCRMTLGLGNVPVQSAFVSAAAAWQWQTSHTLKYMLAHTKFRIYLLLPRGKSPLRSFQLELGFAAILSGLGKGAGDQFTSLARHYRSLTSVWYPSMRSKRARAGVGVRMGLGGASFVVPQMTHWLLEQEGG